jgi:mRNA-degrading endonuclease YafQ of YafQ-DinJ toxin-antitoxin module
LAFLIFLATVEFLKLTKKNNIFLDLLKYLISLIENKKEIIFSKQDAQLKHIWEGNWENEIDKWNRGGGDAEKS